MHLCSRRSLVAAKELPEGSTVGRLTPSLRRLERLERLSFYAVPLAGAIPAEWFGEAGSFPALGELSIQGAGIEGPLPEAGRGALPMLELL